MYTSSALHLPGVASSGAFTASSPRRRQLRQHLLSSAIAFGIALSGLGIVTAAFSPAAAQAAGQGVAAMSVDQQEATLAQYGQFYSHPKYGHAWVPANVPQGWRPYQGCNWVYQNATWFYNDTSPWGAIVHHYGRWAHDAQIGWMWTPAGEDFSPAWVNWQVSADTIGWEPTAPEADIQTVAQTPDDPANWTFVPASAFPAKCPSPMTRTSVAPPPPAAASRILYQAMPVAPAPVYSTRPRYEPYPQQVRYLPYPSPYPGGPVQPNIIPIPVPVPIPTPTPPVNPPSPGPGTLVDCLKSPCTIKPYPNKDAQNKLDKVKVITQPNSPPAPSGIGNDKVGPLNKDAQNKLSNVKVITPAGPSQPAGTTPGGIGNDKIIPLPNGKVTPLPNLGGKFTMGPNKSAEPPLPLNQGMTVHPVNNQVTIPAKTMSGSFSGGFQNQMYHPQTAPSAPPGFSTARPSFGNPGYSSQSLPLAPQHATANLGGGITGASSGGIMTGRSSFSGGFGGGRGGRF
jgi:hypothetical protein